MSERDISSERRLSDAEDAIKRLLKGDYSVPCDFCAEKDNPDAFCTKVLGGTSRYCFEHARWNGRGSG